MTTKTIKFRPSDIVWLHAVALVIPVGEGEENEARMPFSSKWDVIIPQHAITYIESITRNRQIDDSAHHHIDEVLTYWTKQESRIFVQVEVDGMPTVYHVNYLGKQSKEK